MTIRLTVAVVLLEAVLIATAATFIYYESHGLFRRYFDTSLVARADSISSLVDSDESGLRMEEPIWPISRRHPDSSRPDLFWVWPDFGPAIIGSPPTDGRDDVLAQCSEPPAGGRRAFFNLNWSGRGYRAVWIRRDRPAGATSMPEQPAAAYNVLLAISRDQLDKASTELIDSLLIIGGIAMALTAVVTTLLVRWGLRPVHRAARHIAGITAANIGSVPASGGEDDTPREIQPFISALDDLLARLAAAFRQQRSFTAYASHELRTPMAVIKSTIQTCLLRQRDAGEYREALAEVLDDLTRMEHMIDQLLVLARLDAQNEQAGYQPVDLADVLLDVVHQYQQLATEAGVTIEPADASAAVVMGNRELLERMLANLIGNAVRHNRAGGRVMAVCRTAARDVAAESGGQQHRHGSAAASYAVIEIADTGPGIPPEATERIFERFFRLDQARSRGGGGGSGLGLAIVREVVQRHGGTVTGENRPQGGALFRVLLPAGAADPAKDS